MSTAEVDDYLLPSTASEADLPGIAATCGPGWGAGATACCSSSAVGRCTPMAKTPYLFDHRRLDGSSAKHETPSHLARGRGAPHGTPGRSGRTRLPRRSRLDSGESGEGPWRRAAHRAVPHQSAAPGGQAWPIAPRSSGGVREPL